MGEKREIGLYIHIPFCKSKCNYCDFCSFDDKIDKKKEYLEALKKEIMLYKDTMNDYTVKTIYIGGGTPTILEAGEIEELLTEIKNTYEIQKDAEITIEANPGTIGYEKLKKMHEIGINRLSIGLQSANDSTLKLLGRVHDFDEFEQNFINAREVGFKNINVDIMFSLPNETLSDIKNTISKVLSLKPEHISAYSLIIEEDTKIVDILENGDYYLPEDDEDREIYYYICDELKSNGYHQYEISNFAKNGFESKHNIIYWRAEEYLGIGLAAHSYMKDYRFNNVENLEKYIERIKNENKISYKNGKKEKSTIDDKMAEFMFLGLRMLDGIDKSEFNEKFKIDFDEMYGEIIEEMVEDEVLWKEGNKIGLTKRGIDVSNIIFAEFIN